MSKSNHELEYLFHPRSIAMVGVTTSNPAHWTRSLLNGLLELKFDGQLFLVNPKGGEINGHKVHTSLQDIPDNIDYVIGLVPASAAPALVEDCAGKEVKVMQFCTAGFSETGKEEGIRLEAELVKAAQNKQIRIIGPNCMGIYCPDSRLSFSQFFPKESGPVGAITQSGGNANYLVKQGMLRGVRFSKVISYGNACDLNESDFLEYLTADPDTKIIAMYIEGVKDGSRFRRALEKATEEKVVVLLKGGSTEGGARAVASHTSALAGSAATWDSLCKQLGIIRVDSIEGWIDIMVTLLFLPLPRGRNAVIMGGGGGASVLITDIFEKRGLKVPQLPEEIVSQIGKFTPEVGNILQNPIDYSQSMMIPGSVSKTMDIISQWDGVDFMVKFLRAGQSALGRGFDNPEPWINGFFEMGELATKPMAMVLEPCIFPEESKRMYAHIQRSVSSRLPVYFSFDSAAKAINLVLSHYGK